MIISVLFLHLIEIMIIYLVLTNLHIPIFSKLTCGITKLLQDLDPSKAAGPGNISLLDFPSYLLRTLHHVYSFCFQPPLSKVFYLCAGKKATVVPIFKKGSQSDTANYRPISLSSLLCKILEHIIYIYM